ncbi:unnamed protein product [Oncorhynchus mykiss]|uniref:AIG1-type G domain-containing protein n=1 Tax=Oncorhynchus mykiss TaxID=8022 RepID=A0A060X4J0_ONCMY|nr:unnamed protein product [Oncorhynchus mykiss]
MSHDKLSEELRWCVTMSDPGPHVFLLVLQPEEFTQEEGYRIRKILDTLSDRSFDYSMVLTTHEDKRGHMDEDHPLNQMVRACRGRQHLSDRTQLIADVDKIVKENGGDYLTCDVFEDTSGMVQGKEEIHSSKSDWILKSSSKEELGKDVLEQGESAQLNKWENIREIGLVSLKQERQKPSSSHEKLSSLRILLLGKNDDKKSTVGNMILQKEAFRPAPFFNYKQQCESASGKVNGKSVTVVKTPDFFASPLTVRSLMQEMEKCKSLSAPGPHGVLLVLKPEKFTEENRNTFKLILSIFGKEAFKYSMVIITHEGDNIPVDKTAVDFVEQNADTKQLIKICGGRYKIFDASKIENAKQTTELVTEIIKMMDQNRTCYTLYMYMEAKHQSELEEKNRRIKDLEERIRNTSQGEFVEHREEQILGECIRVVLIGKTGNGKSASANTILGRDEFESKISSNSTTTVCKKAVGKVDGRTVSVVDTPGLFDTTLSNKDVQQEIVKCVSLSAPGPHVFIIVLKIGTITQEELNALDLIEKTFGPRAGMFCLVLFTRGDDLGTMLIQDYIGESKIAKLQKLIRDCGGRFHVFNNKDNNNRTQVNKLLKKINEMVSMNKGSFYTNEMFQEAEAAIKRKQEAILKEREAEIKADMEKLKVSHETDMEKMKSKLEEERLKVQRERQLRENMLREREEAIRKEHEDKEKAEKEEESWRTKKEEDEKLKKEIWDTEKERWKKR